MFNNSPSDRVKLAGLGDLVHPAACMVCGNGTCEEGYVNLGVFFDYEGTMYLCRYCVIQVAEIFNCKAPEEAAELDRLLEEAVKLNKELTEKLRISNERLEIYDSVIRDAGFTSVDSSSSSNGISTTVELSGSGVAEQAVSESGSGESVTEESANGEDSTGDSASELFDVTREPPKQDGIVL